MKHSLQAMKLANSWERERLIEDTKNMLQFYESFIKTENEVLNTILTEKSLLCLEDDIKLTCSLSTKK